MLGVQHGKQESRTLRARWERRLAEGQFSPVVVGVRRITQFGQPGAAPQAFPIVRAPRSDECPETILSALAPDERWALESAAQAVANGNDVYAVIHGSGIAIRMQQFTPSANSDILILQPCDS